MGNLIRARVYEVQYGGSVMPYVCYFKDESEINEFIEKTGFRVEILT